MENENLNGVGTAPAEGATPSEPVNEAPAEQAGEPASPEATPEAPASTPEQAN